MKDKISIDDYENGNQSNFDLLSFYQSLPTHLEEEDENNDSLLDFMAKEYHHSLFYPILKYCFDVKNNSKDLDKLNIDLYGKDSKIYITIGRQMHALSFNGDQGPINSHNINFSCNKI